MTGFVSIIVVPRERFSCAKAALDSLYRYTAPGFELIYVDGNSPPYLRSHLDRESAAKGFRLIREEGYLAPNVARNIGFRHATGGYIVFIDNDVVVTPGWLEALTRCADETGADIVGPLYLIGSAANQRIHMAGGILRVEVENGRRRLTEGHRLANRGLDQAREIERGPCQLVEFHCMLVRREVISRFGPLDEKLLSTPEHIDLCLAVQEAGGRVFYEPASVVTYLSDVDYRLSDLDYFRLRWSDAWNESSLRHFGEKWRFAEDSPFFVQHRDWLKSHQRSLQFPDPGAGVAAGSGGGHRYAQTNIQLYNQLWRSGWSDTQLSLVRDTHDFAAALFAASFRACGKPFLAHLVGTASILAANGCPETMVAAGLLHAAYTHGRYGNAPPGVTDAKRRATHKAVGAEVERLVAAYAAFDPSIERIPTLTAGRDDLPLTTAKLLLIKLANEIEDCLDHGLGYSSKSIYEFAAWQPFLSDLARTLGLPELAIEAERQVAEARATSPPGVLRRQRSGAYFLAPNLQSLARPTGS